MKKILQTDEFYVGYIPSAPDKTSVFIKKIIFAGATLLTIVAAALALNQKQFSPTDFEYGVNTTLAGLLVKSPVPHLRISLGKNLEGKELFQMVLLVGSGKHGADDLIEKKFVSMVTIRGYLIYGDGKAILQINDASDITPNDRNVTNSELRNESFSKAETISVTGEITDPKCYFGVMKPGEGKTHRSCAIRCIAGGIPPVLKSNTSDYFLLVNENFESLNADVLPIVGDMVSLDGEVVELDGWKILKVKAKKIKDLTRSTQQRKMLIAMDAEMTFCSH
ncbi:MAG: hypothetical protein HYR67_01535 [Bacteroidetes bacterium]|nr:hypothetical protein [Bacteroidota bacterium]